MGCLELMTDPPCGSPRNDFIYSVRAGSPRIDQISQTTADVPALQVIVNQRYQSHRYWSWVGQANNIALVKLAWALKYNTYVWPICLPNLDFQVKDHSVCTVTGWGLPRVDGESEPPQTGWVGACGRGPRCRPGSETSSCPALISFPLGVSAVSVPWPFRP